MAELNGVHVLVAEDTDDSREMLRVASEDCGALVTTADSAEEAKQSGRISGLTCWSATSPCQTTGSS